MTALKINIPDVSAEIAFNLSEILAAAITSDNVDVNKNADAIVVFISNQRRINMTGINFEMINATIKIGMIISNFGSLINEGMFKSTPTIMKKIGIKTRNQMSLTFQPFLHLDLIMKQRHLLRMHLIYFLRQLPLLGLLIILLMQTPHEYRFASYHPSIFVK